MGSILIFITFASAVSAGWLLQPVSALAAKAKASDSLPELTELPEKIPEFAPKNVKKISLKEAMAIAIENNAALKTARLNLEIAENSADAANYRLRYPTLGLSFARNAVRTWGGIAANQVSTPYTTNANYSLGLTGSLPFIGLQYSVIPAGATLATTDSPFTQPLSYGATKTINFELPLLKGFGPWAYYLDSETNSIALKQAEISYEQNRVSTINSLKNAYFDLYFSAKLMEISNNSLRSAEKLFREIKIQIDNAILPEVEIYNALSHFYSSQAGYLGAQQGFQATHSNFLNLMGINNPTDSKTEQWYLPEEMKIPEEVKAPTIDVDALYAQALLHRADYRLAILGGRSAVIGERKAVNGLFPSLSVVYNIADSGVATNSAIDAIHGAWNRDLETRTLGIKATWSFPLSDERAALKNARASGLLQDVSLAQLTKSIRHEFASLDDRMRASVRRIQASRLAAKLSELKLKAEVSKFRLGEASQKNVIDYTNDLSNAKISEFGAWVGYQKTLIDLDTSLGVTSEP